MRKKSYSKKSGFRKVWFSKGKDKTAGLILPTSKLEGMSIGDISRLFPTSEARKMGKLHMSPTMDTWDQAFNYDK